MFGLTDPIIAAVYLLNLLTVIVCVVYGFRNWNREGPEESPPSEPGSPESSSGEKP